MFGKLVAIATVALTLAGCATSPFYVDKKSSYAPGFIPRNELGQPVFPEPKKEKKAKQQASRAVEAQTATAAPLPQKRTTPNSWLH